MKEYCNAGHLLNSENTYVHLLTGDRRCRVCNTERARVYRSRFAKRRPFHERFFAKIAVSRGCWLWKAAITSAGYGSFWVGSRRRGCKSYQAHRICYQIHRGPIPEGLVLDHLCRVRRCVNPWHLEAVTQEENARRQTRERIPRKPKPGAAA